MADVSTFRERMKEVADDLAPEAKTMVRYVLAREHALRFGARGPLPEEYAREALKLAKKADGAE